MRYIREIDNKMDMKRELIECYTQNHGRIGRDTNRTNQLTLNLTKNGVVFIMHFLERGCICRTNKFYKDIIIKQFRIEKNRHSNDWEVKDPNACCGFELLKDSDLSSSWKNNVQIKSGLLLPHQAWNGCY